METRQKSVLKIPSIPENITVVESFIDSLCREMKIGEELYGNILVSVTEAVNNAMLHGNKGDHSKTVELCFLEKDKTLCFVIRDQGEGFNYETLPDPTAPENLEKPTGRGVFLMKQLSDDVRFSESGRVVEMFFKS